MKNIRKIISLFCVTLIVALCALSFATDASKQNEESQVNPSKEEISALEKRLDNLEDNEKLHQEISKLRFDRFQELDKRIDRNITLIQTFIGVVALFAVLFGLASFFQWQRFDSLLDKAENTVKEAKKHQAKIVTVSEQTTTLHKEIETQQNKAEEIQNQSQNRLDQIELLLTQVEKRLETAIKSESDLESSSINDSVKAPETGIIKPSTGRKTILTEKSEAPPPLKAFEENNAEMKDFEEAQQRANVSSLLGGSVLSFVIWGNEYFKEAQQNKDENLFNEAITMYKKAFTMNPDEFMAINNWGCSLFELAKLSNDERLFRRALAKFRKACSLRPDSTSAITNCGEALFELAKIKQDESLFRRAIRKAKKANKINANFHGAYDTWGAALSGLANLKQDKNLFQEAFPLFEKAYSLKPNIPETLINWSKAFTQLANITKDPAERERLLKESEEKMAIAKELEEIQKKEGNPS